MGEKEGKGEKEKKKEDAPIEVVLKVDMHCEGCASKIKRSVKGFEGVDLVTTDMANNKLTVKGRVDPSKLKDRVEAKTKKKVEILSPSIPAKKDAGGGDKKPSNGGEKKPTTATTTPAPAPATGDSKDQKKSNDKKPKEPAAPTSVTLKIRLHCEGCVQRIKKTILKVKGVKEVTVDFQKDLVTVKGTMEVNSLPSYLKDKLKRAVEIVPGNAGGGDKKVAGGGGEKKEQVAGGGGGGGDKKEKPVAEKKEGGAAKEGGEKKAEATKVAGAPAMVEANKMEFYGSYGYREEMLHAPQLFSDENPNACTLM